MRGRPRNNAYLIGKNIAFKGPKHSGTVFVCQRIFFIEKQGLAVQLGKGRWSSGRYFEKSAHLLDSSLSLRHSPRWFS
jgi:hypothetical protein